MYASSVAKPSSVCERTWLWALVVLCVCFASASFVHAHAVEPPEDQDAGIDFDEGPVSETFATNRDAAERAFTVLSSRAPRPGTPHLDPVKTRAAMTDPQYIGKLTFVIAHRGYHSAPGCPENSACALAAAYDAGADGAEFDVKLTRKDPSGYVGVVFGHDYTMGREQAAWDGKTSSGGWDFFGAFPGPDPAYTPGGAGTTFGISFGGGNNHPGVNDRRAMLYEFQQVGDRTFNGTGDWTLRDTFGAAIDTQFELNLYQYLYLTQTHFPLMPWLDIKGLADLKEAGKVIKLAQKDFADNRVGPANGTGGAVHAIALKLGPNVLLGTKSKNYADAVASVRALTQVADLSYFFVFGTGELDRLVQIGQSLPSCATGCTATAAALAGFRSVCRPSDGCLGGEVAHKHPDAPTQTLFDQMKTLGGQGVQTAAFQTIPQYEWYWRSLPAATQMSTFGAWSGRTDGSCCFSLLQTQLLNSSTAFGAETGDWRPDYGWNESNFTTITTDEPANVLKDLWTQGRRPSTSVQALMSSDSRTTQSGGMEVSVARDGLYALVNLNSGLGLDAAGGPGLVQKTVTYLPSQLWYVAFLGQGGYSLTNAATNRVLSAGSNGPALTPASNAASTIWAMGSLGDGTVSLINGWSVALGVADASTAEGAGITQTYPGPGAIPVAQRWFLRPIVAPGDMLKAGVSPSVAGRPSDLHTAALATAVPLDWKPPAYTANGAALSYRITADPGGFAAQSPVGQKSAIVRNLVHRSSYTLSVEALNAAGQAGAASQIAANTQILQPPQNVRVTGSTASTVTLAWDPPANAGPSSTLRYHLAADDAVTSAHVQMETQNTTGVLGPLVNFDVNYLTVYTYTDGSNDMGPYGGTTFGGGLVPPAPQNVVAKSAGAHGLTLAWDDPTYYGALYKPTYTARVWKDGTDISTADVTTTTSPSADFTGLPQGPWRAQVQVSARRNTDLYPGGVTPQVLVGASWSADPPPGYNNCANENGSCETYNTYFAYGANNSYYFYSNLLFNTSCNNATLGDPSVGNGKSCSKGRSTPDQFPICAREGGTCAAGAGGGTIYFYISLNGRSDHRVVQANLRRLAPFQQIGCNVDSLGDPAPGAGKVCAIADLSGGPVQ